MRERESWVPFPFTSLNMIEIFILFLCQHITKMNEIFKCFDINHFCFKALPTSVLSIFHQQVTTIRNGGARFSWEVSKVQTFKDNEYPYVHPTTPSHPTKR